MDADPVEEVRAEFEWLPPSADYVVDLDYLLKQDGELLRRIGAILNGLPALLALIGELREEVARLKEQEGKRVGLCAECLPELSVLLEGECLMCNELRHREERIAAEAERGALREENERLRWGEKNLKARAIRARREGPEEAASFCYAVATVGKADYQAECESLADIRARAAAGDRLLREVRPYASGLGNFDLAARIAAHLEEKP